jgi:hypothetical protein
MARFENIFQSQLTAKEKQKLEEQKLEELNKTSGYRLSKLLFGNNLESRKENQAEIAEIHKSQLNKTERAIMN